MLCRNCTKWLRVFDHYKIKNIQRSINSCTKHPNCLRTFRQGHVHIFGVFFSNLLRSIGQLRFHLQGGFRGQGIQFSGQNRLIPPSLARKKIQKKKWKKKKKIKKCWNLTLFRPKLFFFQKTWKMPKIYFFGYFFLGTIFFHFDAPFSPKSAKIRVDFTFDVGLPPNYLKSFEFSRLRQCPENLRENFKNEIFEKNTEKYYGWHMVIRNKTLFWRKKHFLGVNRCKLCCFFADFLFFRFF